MVCIRVGPISIGYNAMLLTPTGYSTITSDGRTNNLSSLKSVVRNKFENVNGLRTCFTLYKFSLVLIFIICWWVVACDRNDFY